MAKEIQLPCFDNAKELLVFANGFCYFVSDCFIGDMVCVTYAKGEKNKQKRMPRSCLYVLISKDSPLRSISAVRVHVSHAYKKFWRGLLFLIFDL